MGKVRERLWLWLEQVNINCWNVMGLQCTSCTGTDWWHWMEIVPCEFSYRIPGDTGPVEKLFFACSLLIIDDDFFRWTSQILQLIISFSNYQTTITTCFSWHHSIWNLPIKQERLLFSLIISLYNNSCVAHWPTGDWSLLQSFGAEYFIKWRFPKPFQIRTHIKK